ncbi:hypothetical protein ABEY52_22215 [Priestia aryabhattai]|uniref:hypothetical protein n=1 Tax=Priestia aryabhattai TaxID=412384 RepID=UPI003D2E0874
MTIERGTINLDSLKRIKVLDIPFGYKIEKNEKGVSDLIVLPLPDVSEDFHKGTKYFSLETLALLRNKYTYGIKHRTQLFEIMYNTFVHEYGKKQKGIDELLTLQSLFSDLIIRLGTILEDFAGMCYACKQYKQHKSDIAQVFLTYSDPMSFYKAIILKKGKRKIKQIFDLPESKGKLTAIFQDLSEEEITLLMKAIEYSATLIHEKFHDISEAIVRAEKESVTYYDIYNKLKHGYSPYYPFGIPIAAQLGVTGENLSEETIKKLISKSFFENLTIMHDKLPGQRKPEEQKRYDEEKLGTPTWAAEEVTLKKVEKMMIIVSEIDFIYRHLMKVYLLRSEGNPHLTFLMSDKYLNLEEREIVQSIINDKSRYKN